MRLCPGLGDAHCGTPLRDYGYQATAKLCDVCRSIQRDRDLAAARGGERGADQDDPPEEREMSRFGSCRQDGCTNAATRSGICKACCEVSPPAVLPRRRAMERLDRRPQDTKPDRSGSILGEIDRLIEVKQREIENLQQARATLAESGVE